MVNEMKVDMLYDLQLEGHGAGTTHTMELFENLKKIGNEVDLFVLAKPKNAAPYKRANISFLPILNIPLLRGVSYQLVLLFYYLLYQIKRTKPHVIYARISLLTISPLILSKLLKIPYVVEINGLGIDEMKLSNTSKLTIQILKVNEKLNYKHAKKIVAVTQGVKEGIKELYNIPDEKIVVIENGSNIKLFRPMNIAKAPKKLNFDRDANYVCFVGHLAPWQGVEYLIKSAPRILKEFPNVRFLIVGDGQMKEELVELAEKTGVSDKFIFTGAVPYEEVPKYINASDVCVHLPFGKRNERVGASSLKLFEYMACGKPIITTDVDGIPKEIERVNAGILVSCNLQEIAGNIIKLLKSEKMREEMGKNGRKCVVENHSWGIVAEKVARVCENVIKQRKYR
jgi:glycosyltransferase involved in cell wall biosynthesis